MIINPNIFNFDKLMFDSAKIFSFELELPDFDAMMSKLQGDKDLVKMMESFDQNEDQNSMTFTQLAEARMNLIKSLQALAQKDKIPVKMKSVDDIKLFINYKDLFKGNEGYRIKMDSFSKEDFDFFKLCSDKKEITVNEINSNDSRINFMAADNANQVSYKSINLSKGLFNLIEYSFKKQKPVRLDFKGDSSVILRVSQSGKVSAEFITNDTAMEHILRNSIPNLKNKLDSDGIPYEKIFYRENQEKNKKRNKGGKK